MSNIKGFRINSENIPFQIVDNVNSGLMSAEDKILLDALVEANINDSSTITISGDTIDFQKEIDNISSILDDNDKKIARINSILNPQGYCGRVWDESDATPKAMTWCGNLNMLRNLPELIGLGCYLVQPDHTRRKLDQTDHYKFADDGTEARLDGSDGHYQWGWNKVFYISFWYENNLFYEVISLEPIKGRLSYRVPIGSISACGYAAYDAENNKICSYINFNPNFRGGKQNASFDDDLNRTLLSRPITNMSTATFMNAAHKIGEGWFAGSMRMSAVLKVLFDIIMGTRNCQASFNPIKDSDGLYQGGLGAGVTNLFDGNGDIWSKYNGVNPFLPLDVCVDKGDACCISDEMSITYLDENDNEITDTFYIPVFFGLKNPYGYLWKVSEDECGMSEADEPYIMIHYARPLLMSGEYVYGNIEHYRMLSVTDSGNRYIQHLSYNNLEIFPIGSIGNGSSLTYHCDHFWYYNPSASIRRAVFRGGSAGSVQLAGLTTIYVSYPTTHVYGYIGVALVEFTEEFPIDPINV